MMSDRVEWTEWPVLVHSARTAVAAVASLLAARLFRLPEAYWAPITTLVITQSSLGAALTVSRQRASRRGALGSNCISVRRRYTGDCAVGVADGSCMAHRL